MHHSLVLSTVLAVVLLASCGPADDRDPRGDLEAGDAEAADPDSAATTNGHPEWQRARLAGLTAEDGWLTLTGLFWLEPGRLAFGPGEDNDLVLPRSPALEEAPDRLGTLVIEEDSVRLEPDAELLVDGEPVGGPGGQPVDLVSDGEGTPTTIAFASLEAHVIERGGHLALRVRDRQLPVRLDFPGIDSWPYDPAWRKQARFEPYGEAREVEVPNVTPYDYPGISVGEVVFEHDGNEHRLVALSDDASEPLFLVVGDTTNGKASYGGGRYVYTVGAPAADGSVVVDFNRLYNPPCVFTEWATCPLPPRSNRLGFPIEAGEKDWPH